jgi:hypothetical protein
MQTERSSTCGHDGCSFAGLHVASPAVLEKGLRKGPMKERILYILSAVVALASLIVPFALPLGGVVVCDETTGCHRDMSDRIFMVLIGLAVAGILLAAARAQGDRWRRDARQWKG